MRFRLTAEHGGGRMSVMRLVVLYVSAGLGLRPADTHPDCWEVYLTFYFLVQWTFYKLVWLVWHDYLAWIWHKNKSVMNKIILRHEAILITHSLEEKQTVKSIYSSNKLIRWTNLSLILCWQQNWNKPDYCCGTDSILYVAHLCYWKPSISLPYDTSVCSSWFISQPQRPEPISCR